MSADKHDGARCEAQCVTNAPRGGQPFLAAEAMFERVHRRARLAGFGARTGRPKPRLPETNERGLPRAALRRPSLGAALARGTNGLLGGSLQVTDHAKLFLLSTVGSLEFRGVRRTSGRLLTSFPSSRLRFPNPYVHVMFFYLQEVAKSISDNGHIALARVATRTGPCGQHRAFGGDVGRGCEIESLRDSVNGRVGRKGRKGFRPPPPEELRQT